MVSDFDLKQRVLDELDWDVAVDAAHIGVTAADGSVTLSGHVASYPEKLSALEAARRVRGVRVVADDIEVHLPAALRRDDSDIAARIAHVFESNVSIPDAEVKAKVSNGYVTLTGQVDWEHQRRHIEAQVRHVGGVRSVSNAITLKARVTPKDVKDRIEKALHRNADLEASNVRVSVNGDRVVLDGSVKAYYEKQLIERAVWAAPGVRDVVDHLHLS